MEEELDANCPEDSRLCNEDTLRPVSNRSHRTRNVNVLNDRLPI